MMKTPSQPAAARKSKDDLLGLLQIDEQSFAPLYKQIHVSLAKLIEDKQFGPNDALPSERELADRLGVSRVTARKAIDSLVEDGLIVRRHGSGNYVAPFLEQPLTQLTSFTEELKKRGFVPSSRWLRRELGGARSDELVSLGLSPGTTVARLERVRMASRTPMAHEVSTLPASVLQHPEAVQDSLYNYLEQRGNAPVRALQHFRAVNASAEQSELLQLPERQALLFITRVGYDANDRAIEVTHTWCCSDYYDFIVELRR